MSEQQLLLSEPEAAKALACSAKTLARLVAAGRMKCVRLASRKLYDPSDLREFIELNKTSGPATAKG